MHLLHIQIYKQANTKTKRKSKCKIEEKKIANHQQMEIKLKAFQLCNFGYLSGKSIGF